MNMRPLEGDWGKQSELEAAWNRIMDDMERGREPKAKDITAARACKSCWGMGYYYPDPDSDDRKDCKTCGGCGLAENHPNFVKG